MSFQWKVDSLKVKNKVAAAFENIALPAISNQALSDCNKYAPQDQGGLIASSLAASKPKDGVLVWNTPYARYLWYGVLMVAPNGSAFAHSGESKHSTGTPLDYDKTKNANAGAQWAERARQAHGAEWAKVGSNALGGK